MKKKYLQWISLFLFLLFSWSAVHAETAGIPAGHSIPVGQRPFPVKVALYLNDISSVDEAKEMVDLNATLILQWKDPRLAFNKTLAGTAVKSYKINSTSKVLSEIWYPQVELVGEVGPRNDLLETILITDTGLVTWVESFEAKANLLMNLRRFPFDKQVITLKIQPFLDDASHVRLEEYGDLSGISQYNKIAGWKLDGFKVGVRDVVDPIFKKAFSQYYFSMQYNRLSEYYVYQLFLPIMLIVFLSFSVFWMLDNPVVNRVAISLTAVLTIVVFQWRLEAKLPRVNYHMFSDIFLLISFVVAASTVVTSLMLHHYVDPQKKARLARLCRYGYPIVYALALLVAVLFHF